MVKVKGELMNLDIKSKTVTSVVHTVGVYNTLSDLDKIIECTEGKYPNLAAEYIEIRHNFNEQLLNLEKSITRIAPNEEIIIENANRNYGE